LGHSSWAALALFAVSGIASTALGANLTAAENSAGKDRIRAEYKTERLGCDAFSGNEKDICVQKAKGKAKVARAELKYQFSGKVTDQQKIAVVQADARFAVSKEVCDDLAGDPKALCRAEAKATHTKSIADAKLAKTVSTAGRDAAGDKRDAEYQVATEKCEPLAGDTKAACVSEAKTRFNKN
jgi:hypothetical protein